MVLLSGADVMTQLVKANDRIPRKALASNGKMFNDGTDTSYAAQVLHLVSSLWWWHAHCYL